MRIAINGLGRIGRIFLRQALKVEDFEIVAINDLADKDTLLYLLSHDTVYGRFDYNKDVVEAISFSQEKDPASLPWGDLGIDVVVEATGVFATNEKAKAHLDAGAKRVVITAPAKDAPEAEQTPTFTPNVGVDFAAQGQITSNASCTTNAITPVMAVMMDNPGVKKAILNTIHGYTSTQGLVDRPNKKDLRKGRAAAMNIVPSSTGSAIATSKAIPEIGERFDGIAMRVPVIAGSVIDFTFVTEKETSVEEINTILREAADKPEWQGILKVSDEPLVSSDILGDPHGSIVDPDFTRVIDGDLVKIVAWYDNEWGYGAMLVKHIEQLKTYL